MSELKPANENPDFGKVCIHGSLKRQCYTCELEGSNDWLKKVNQDLRDEIDKLKHQNQKMRVAVNKCLDHWALVAGPSAFERSGMRVLLEEVLKEGEEK